MTAVKAECEDDGSGAIGALVEGTTRYVMLVHLPRMRGPGDGPWVKNGPALAGHGAEAVRDAIAASIQTLPARLRRPLAWDQGAEMAEHVQLHIDTGIQISFCDPRSPGSAAQTKTWPPDPGPRRRRRAGEAASTSF